MGSGGEYTLAINDVGPSGVPTNSTIATATLSSDGLPAPDFTAAVTYPNPPAVTAGQQYALVLTRSVGNLTAHRTDNDVCPGGALFESPTHTDPFAPAFTQDILYAIFVEPAIADTTSPDTTITKQPKSKTKKKSATFEFSGTDARAVAGFECSLDGAAFSACSSPVTVKVKKGRHTFSVRAADGSGNVDGAPATADWRVKKKKRR